MAGGDDSYFYNRSWMYMRKFDSGDINLDFIARVKCFIDYVTGGSRTSELRCPCSKCKNVKIKSQDEVVDHLLWWGFVPDYYDWRCHCDVQAGESSSGYVVFWEEAVQMRPTERQNSDGNQFVHMVHDAAVNRFPDQYNPFITDNDSPYAEQHSPLQFIPEDPDPEARQFYEMLSATNNPLYPGCETYTQMSMIGRLPNMKTTYHFPERLYDELCTMMQEALPQPNSMTSGFYDTKKKLAGLGLPSQKIDCCVNGCMIYWGTTTNVTCCSTCGVKRYSKDANGKKSPRKQFYYLPIGPRLQRLYESQATASQMRWHDEHYREDGEMCHPSDSEAWLRFNDTHPDFVAETRNVRLGLCTDGFNPFRCSGK